MVNYFIYAKDYSGSTNGVKFYHDSGLKTLEQFKHDTERLNKELLLSGTPSTESKIIYLHWNNKCVEVDEQKTTETYKSLSSDWLGTYPQTIIGFLKDNYIFNESDKIKLLYIITDGLIDHQSATECFRSNADMHYETFIFHAFNEDLRAIDVSVAASFFTGHCKVYRNSELYDSTDVSKEFDYDHINVDNFEAEKEELKSYIKLKYMRNVKQDANALKEIDKLKNLRGRLFQELSSKSNKKRKLKMETKDRNEFLTGFVNTDWYKNLFATVYEQKVVIEKSISTLINYIVSDAKSYSFDALKFDIKFDKPVENEQIDVNNIDFTVEEEIEFPDAILADDRGVPVVILTEFKLMDKIIFHRTKASKEVTPASFSKFKSAMECPLFLVNDQDLSESIGYFYTLNVYKQLLANKKYTEPRTRRPFRGGLVLTSSDQFDRYNDYIVSVTYFDGKKVNYNVGLFYYVLWKLSESKEWMDRNVVEQFKKYAMRRISETVCKIGLSSLPLDPQENTSLLTALWYCVELSSCIFKDDPLNFKQERLRMYHGVARYMIEILNHFDYNLDLEAIRKRRELIGHVMALKKIQKGHEKVYYLLKDIFKTTNGFLVSEIEKPFNLYKLNYLKLDHKEILHDKVVDEKVHLNDYIHLMHIVGDVSKTGEGLYKICAKTFRPFFAIDRDKSFYTELVNNTKKVVIKNDDDENKIEVAYEVLDSLEFDRILSLYKLFINCVQDSEKYPNLSEYIEYVSKKKKFHGDAVTIFPLNVYVGIKRVYELYQTVIKDVQVKQFIKTSEANVGRTARIKTEERVKLSDNEINEFISSEELKVRLKKKT